MLFPLLETGNFLGAPEASLVVEVGPDDVHQHVGNLVLVVAGCLHPGGGGVHERVCLWHQVVGDGEVGALSPMLHPDSRMDPRGGARPPLDERGRHGVVAGDDVLLCGHSLVHHELGHDVEDCGDVCHAEFLSPAPSDRHVVASSKSVWKEGACGLAVNALMSH